MLNLIVIAGILLIVGILLLIFRINVLVDIAKGDEDNKETKSNAVNGALMLLFLIVSFGALFYYSVAHWDLYNLPVASEHGLVTDHLFWVTMVVTGIVFLITQILLFWYSFKYSYKKSAKAYFFPDNAKLELLWTIVPAVAMAILVFMGLKSWNDITDKAPENAEQIEVMGFQFAWKVRYAGIDGELGGYDWRYIDLATGNDFGLDFNDDQAMDDFMPRKMFLPVNRPVLLNIRARDVLHSVYLPHFRVKMDAVPGMPTKFWFVPTKTTEQMRIETENPEFTYEMGCTEVCGRGHFSMRFEVVVLEQDEYDEWYKAQKSWASQNQEFVNNFRGMVNAPATAKNIHAEETEENKVEASLYNTK